MIIKYFKIYKNLNNKKYDTHKINKKNHETEMK